MLVILSGVSGAGKDTIKKELLKRMNDVTTLPSYTSRKMRLGEEEGVQYHFISKEEFEAKIRQNDFYEYSLHHGNYYGTSRELMNEKLSQGKIIVKDIEVNGTENLIKLLGRDTRIVTIFLKVEKEELKRRLIERGDSIPDIEVRLSRLEYEESKLKLYDYVIKNDEKKHVGLRNIRGRLKAMVNGALVMESKPGVGTKAIIMIPKEVTV